MKVSLSQQKSAKNVQWPLEKVWWETNDPFRTLSPNLAGQYSYHLETISSLIALKQFSWSVVSRWIKGCKVVAFKTSFSRIHFILWRVSRITLILGLTVPRLVVNWRRVCSLKCLGRGVGWGHSIIEHTDIKRNILYQVPPTTDTWDGKRLSY